MPKHSNKRPRSTSDAGQRPLKGGLAKPLTPSPAAIVGAAPLPRATATVEVWRHIHAHGLQNPANRREIVADDVLRPVIGERCGIFDLPRHLSAHLHGTPTSTAAA